MNDAKAPTLSPAEQELHDEEMIQAAFQRLIDTYLASSHRRKVDIITRAFNFAKNAHKGVRRKSGEPYILHPIAVAQLVCGDIGLGSTSICAALLHDVVEDTDYTYDDIANLFGVKVANIVEGVTKISGEIFNEKGTTQAETFKKLLITMSDDIRVILIKLADRVHNMRTLESMAPGKQLKIAGETMYLYAPIADRLGLNKIKIELENLSFKYEHPAEYEEVCQKLEEARPQIEHTFATFTPPIRKKLDEEGYTYTITSRVKSPYSIWRKMNTRHISFEEVYDLLAVRIVFKPKEKEEENKGARNIYNLINDIYDHHPTRERDWLRYPKPNGYQAIHQTFMNKNDEQGRWVEVQIRSEHMDEVAERGLAAHWKYKGATTFEDSKLEEWINSIKAILDDPQPDTLALLDNFKLNLFARELTVFTPKGEMRTIPLGSTVLDFAFSIHTTIGTHCFGAKVNHRLVSRNYILKNGDQVEIITSATERVSSEWLNHVTTAKARSKIEAILRRQNREYARKGETMLQEWLESKNQQLTPSRISRLCTYYGLHSPEELYMCIGKGETTLDDEAAYYLRGRKHYKDWRRFVPFIHDKVTDTEPAKDSSNFFNGINRKQIFPVTDEALPHCTIAPCCTPIPGDNIIGILPEGATQMTIHHRACDVATQLKARHGNDIIAATWDLHRTHLFRTTIHIEGIDDKGVLYSIADLLKSMTQFPVHRIALDTEDGIFNGEIVLSVSARSDIADICKRLRSIENIQAAHRAEINKKSGYSAKKRPEIS